MLVLCVFGASTAPGRVEVSLGSSPSREERAGALALPGTPGETCPLHVTRLPTCLLGVAVRLNEIRSKEHF